MVEFLFGAMSDFFAPEKFPLETGWLLVKGFVRGKLGAALTGLAI